MHEPVRFSQQPEGVYMNRQQRRRRIRGEGRPRNAAKRVRQEARAERRAQRTQMYAAFGKRATNEAC